MGTVDQDHIQSFAKIGTGYTMDELREIIETIREHVVPFSEPPAWWAPWADIQAKVRPDFIFKDINKTFVMEVIGAEIVPSDTFSLGLTLRFPRCVRGKHIRHDKTWIDADTSAGIRNFASGNTQSKHVQDSGDEEPPIKRKQPIRSSHTDLNPETRPYVEVTSDAFKGKRVKILLSSIRLRSMFFHSLPEKDLPASIAKSRLKNAFALVEELQYRVTNPEKPTLSSPTSNHSFPSLLIKSKSHFAI